MVNLQVLRKPSGSNGTVRIPLSAPSGVFPPPGEDLLPRGRVEVVMFTDPQLVAENEGRTSRISFDYERFSKDENGNRLLERQWKPYVAHVLGIIKDIMTHLAGYGLEPVYCGKQDGDLIEVGLWENPRNPPVIIECLGWRVTRFVIDRGNQCVKGFDPKMDVITDLSKWPL